MEKQMNKKMIIGIAVGVVALLVVIIAVTIYKPTIKLNEYVKVIFSGYDTLGEAEVIFDMESFCKDYEGKIKKLDGTESSGTEQFAKRVMKDSELDRQKNLSNGDEITYEWKFAVATLESVYECKIECSDIKFTVEGLEEIETCDVFADLVVSYEGIAPYGSVTITNNATEDYAKTLVFTTDATNLNNGDIVTVAIDFMEDYGDVNGYVEVFGKAPEVLEKDFVVEGLPEYITTTSQLSDDVMTSLKQQAETIHSQHVTEEWCNGKYGETANVTGMEYVGAYVLASNGTSMFNKSLNKVLMVYKVNAHMESKLETLSLSGDTSYYTAIVFDDVYVENDGTLVVSKSGVLDKTNYKLELIHDTNTLYKRTFYFYGYATLEELFKNEVESNLSIYNYEAAIK